MGSLREANVIRGWRVRRWAQWLAIACLLAGQSAAAIIRTAPDKNPGTAVAQGAQLGASIGGTIGGFVAPFPFSIAFEAVALGADIGLKHTPPLLVVPNAIEQPPNATSSILDTHQSCVYRFDKKIIGNTSSSTHEEGYSSVWGVPFDLVDDNFGDLQRPAVYHPYADVSVTATSPFLGDAGYIAQHNLLRSDSGLSSAAGDLSPTTLSALRSNPEFPEGRHQIRWQASTSLNKLMDLAFPTALFAATTLAEFKLQQKATVIAAKNTAKAREASKTFLRRGDNILNVLTVAELVGFTTADVTSAGQAEDWYQRTSITTAVNSGVQNFTVWDVNSPYMVDSATHRRLNGEQTISLEATDFGGVRFGRVREQLMNRFRAVDDCAKPFNVTTDAPNSLLLKLDTDNEVVWDARELNGGPYRTNFALRTNQERVGENLQTWLTQQIVVQDTQAPILVPPAGFARYSDTPVDTLAGDFPLGRPLVVDLADPSPMVTNDAPALLELDRRYSIFWQASDDSGNSTASGPFDPAPYTQVVTIKTPGTNTPPTATPASASTTTSAAVEIVLQGSDADIIDGIADPLGFEIDNFPGNGEFEAPLLPYFIDDYRLTPLGEREEGDNLSRTSPLLHLADEFRLLDANQRALFLTEHICQPSADSRDAVFSNVIPVDFVYQPRTVLTDDDRMTFILDSFWVCETAPGNSGGPAAQRYARIARWTPEGEFLQMQSLQDSYEGFYPDPPWTNLQPGDFTVDHANRIWLRMSPIISTFGQGVVNYSMTKNFADILNHGGSGYSETEVIMGKGIGGVAGDTEFGLFYELHSEGGPLFGPQQGLTNFLKVREVLDPEFQLSNDENLIGEIRPAGTEIVRGSDIKLDSTGAVYVSDSTSHRIHKYSPTRRNSNGEWVLGEYIGWMGSCTLNNSNSIGVFYNACDEELGVSKGFACTDLKCARAADPAGAGQGQFNDPGSIALDPRDILYVADRNNLRVQRFASDGTFGGEAKSTGSGINLGAEPGFILGNMGRPGKITVNSSSFYVMERAPQNGDFFVHHYKTLPFFDVTDSSARVKYVSEFDFQGTDQFTYYTSDGIDRSSPAIVDVSVARAFRAPEQLRAQCFASQTLQEEIPCSLDEDSGIFIRLSASDKDGFLSTGGLDTLTFSVVSPPAGTLATEFGTDNSQVLQYSPAPDYFGIDRFRFSANDGDKDAAQDVEVVLTINPTPDPVAIVLPDDLRGARGFPLFLTADYSDVDLDPDFNAPLVSLAWGDGSVALGADWVNSGRFDANEREISPKLPLGNGSGMLLGSHSYSNAGRYPLAVVMENAAAEGLPPSTAITSVDIIEATVVNSHLVAPDAAVDPAAPFAINIEVTNLEPTGWSGLVAASVVAELEIPEGLALPNIDTRCTGTVAAGLSCALGDLQAGETATLAFTGLVPIEAARDSAVYGIQLVLTDAGPKVRQQSLGFATIELADQDADGRFDVEDAFPDDARYFADADGDGLPDAWELAYGFDPDVADDATADTDGDGFSLQQEFLQTSFPELAERPSFVAGTLLEAPEGGPGTDGFAASLAGADLNQDGFADTLVGAPGYGGTGTVFVAYGSASGANTAYQELNPGAAGFGKLIAAGDLDGNSYPDVVVVANEVVYVHFNNGELLTDADLVIDPAPSLGATPITATTGDLDGDGTADLVIATRLATGATTLLVYRSDESGPEGDPELFTLTGELFNDIEIADLDGDGLNDLLLSHNAGDGEVRGFFGNANSWRGADGLTAAFSLNGKPTQSRFGWQVASGADLFGDGIDDLVVGAYGGRGSVSVFDSASSYWLDGEPSQIILGVEVTRPPGDSHADQFGLSVDIGHLDTDSYADLLVGANRAFPQDQGQIHIIRGGAAGLATEFQIEPGEREWGLLGHTSAIIGDIDGDGVADVAGGAPNYNTAQSPAPTGGYVQLYYHAFEAIDPDEDSDGDGVRAALDNCPDQVNTNQADLDGDGAGNDCDADADADGLDGSWEINNELDPLDPADADLDLDGDGLSNREEFALGTAANNDDTDADGIADGVEVASGSDPLFGDTDGDGLPNSQELDDDDDGLLDEYERSYGLSAVNAADALGDLDGDGYSTLAESRSATRPDDGNSVPVLPSLPTLFASVLPGHRATQVGSEVTAFATIINGGEVTATDCGLVPLRPIAGRWAFTPTDPATNAVDGVANESRDIAAGEAQSYVFRFTPTAAVTSDMELWFDCSNTAAAQVLIGLNTFGITAGTVPTPDVVALSATPSNDGILRIPGLDATGAFAIASVNVGATGAVRARVRPSDDLVLLTVLCETDSTTGQCQQTPAAEVGMDIATDATPTFSVFAASDGAIGLDPASRRIFVEFLNAANQVVGSTSVAVMTN